MKDKNDMTQEERCIYLIRTMQKEMPQYRGIVIPEEGAEQKRLLRSLMNVRPPMPASSDFLAVQDMYLSEENAARGILDGAELAPVKGNSRICLWQGDITRLKTGAIVNAANRAPLGCFRPVTPVSTTSSIPVREFSCGLPAMRLWKLRAARSRPGVQS